VCREVRLRRGKAREEVLRGAGGARGDRRQPDTGASQGTACQLVGHARVEVVDERVDVPRERVGRHRRGGMRDRVELAPHLLVDRRSPERMPAAVRRLEVRMDEAGRDRPFREVDDRADDACRAPELEALWRVGREREELVELEPASPGLGRVAYVDDNRPADVQPVGRERSVPVADDRVRARVVLPEQLEGGGGDVGGVVERLGHEPVSIGSRRDVPTGFGC
jgi:hypothetical protein